MGHYLKPLTLAPRQPKTQPSRSGCSELPPSVWVQLITPPSAYSQDQALLLCRHSEDEWVVWIPNYGEMVLHVSEFYFDSAWN